MSGGDASRHVAAERQRRASGVFCASPAPDVRPARARRTGAEPRPHPHPHPRPLRTRRPRSLRAERRPRRSPRAAGGVVPGAKARVERSRAAHAGREHGRPCRAPPRSRSGPAERGTSVLARAAHPTLRGEPRQRVGGMEPPSCSLARASPLGPWLPPRPVPKALRLRVPTRRALPSGARTKRTANIALDVADVAVSRRRPRRSWRACPPAPRRGLVTGCCRADVRLLPGRRLLRQDLELRPTGAHVEPPSTSTTGAAAPRRHAASGICRSGRRETGVGLAVRVGGAERAGELRSDGEGERSAARTTHLMVPSRQRPYGARLPQVGARAASPPARPPLVRGR